jgi:hypothetical protein
LEWKQFVKAFGPQPAKEIFESATPIDDMGLDILWYHARGEEDIAEHFAYKYPNYRDERDEFKRKRLAKDINKKLLAMRDDLLKTDYCYFDFKVSLGNYDFKKKLFPISVGKWPRKSSGLYYEDGRFHEGFTSVGMFSSWQKAFSFDFADQQVQFPPPLNTDEATGERIVNESPNREVILFVIFKPSSGRLDYEKGRMFVVEGQNQILTFRCEYILYATARMEVVGIYPSAKSSPSVRSPAYSPGEFQNLHALSLTNELKELLTSQGWVVVGKYSRGYEVIGPDIGWYLRLKPDGTADGSVSSGTDKPQSWQFDQKVNKLYVTGTGGGTGIYELLAVNSDLLALRQCGWKPGGELDCRIEMFFQPLRDAIPVLENKYNKTLNEYEGKKSLMSEKGKVSVERELQQLKKRIDDLKKELEK